MATEYQFNRFMQLFERVVVVFEKLADDLTEEPEEE